MIIPLIHLSNVEETNVGERGLNEARLYSISMIIRQLDSHNFTESQLWVVIHLLNVPNKNYRPACCNLNLTRLTHQCNHRCCLQSLQVCLCQCGWCRNSSWMQPFSQVTVLSVIVLVSAGRGLLLFLKKRGEKGLCNLNGVRKSLLHCCYMTSSKVRIILCVMIVIDVSSFFPWKSEHLL